MPQTLIFQGFKVIYLVTESVEKIRNKTIY